MKREIKIEVPEEFDVKGFAELLDLTEDELWSEMTRLGIEALVGIAEDSRGVDQDKVIRKYGLSSVLGLGK